MKNKIKINLILLSVIFLFFLFGCTEMTLTEKNLCYNLTSKSFAYIPPCETEDSCFKKVNEIFDNTSLGYEQESELYDLKNKLARSWFFYNKALKEIKKAPNYCLDGDAGSLSSTINQTSQYLDYSFTELDKSLRKSFDIISKEETLLNSQEIELIKEEPLYDSLIEIKQITSEMKNGSTNSGTYYSYYIKKIDEFNALGIKKGFSELIEEDSIFIKIYKFGTKKIFETSELKKIQIPLIGLNYDTIEKTLERTIENTLYSQQSLKELQKFPIYEFTFLYSSVAGNNNSAIKRFADLINKVNENKKILEKNRKITWENIELEKNKLNQLKKRANSFSRYEIIQKELLEQIISGETPTNDLILEVEKEYLSLREEKNNNSISLGKEILKAKNLYEKLLIINNRINFETGSEIKKIEEACNKKAEEINQITNIPSQLSSIYNELLFYSKKTISNTGEEKINYCTELINIEKELILGIKDFKQLEEQKTQNTRECFNYLEELFKIIESDELENQFNQLKKETVTPENIIYFEKACISIKNQIDNEINDDKEMEELFKEKEINDKLKNKIELFELYSLTNLTELKNKANMFDDYFKKENLLELFSIRSQLLEKIEKNNFELTTIFEKEVINYFKMNYKLITLSDSIPETGKDSNIVLRLAISNPFFEIKTPFSIEIPQKLSLKESNICVKNILFGDTTIILFECLESGLTNVDFYATETVTTIEKDEIIYATNEKSLLERNISLITENSYTKLLISTKKLSETPILLVNEIETNFFIEEEKIKFYAENVNKKTNINCYFYLNNLISLNITKLSEKNEGLSKEITYKIIAKNNYENDLKATLIFPIYSNLFVTNIQVLDEEKIKKNYEIIEDKITLKNIDFIKKQQKEFLAIINISNKNDYYQTILENLADELNIYQETMVSKEIRETLNDLENISEDQLNVLIKKGETTLEKIKIEYEEDKITLLIKENLKEEIEKYKNKIIELEKYGLEEEKNALLNKIKLSEVLLESEKRTDILKGLSLLENEPIMINEELKKEVEKLFKIIKEDVGKDLSLIELSTDFFEKKQEFDQWKEIDALKSQEIFLELKESYLKYYIDKNEITTKITPANEILNKFEEDLLESKRLISILEQELSIEESKLINAKFIQPITLSRLKKLKLDLTEIESSIFSEENRDKLIEIKGELKSALESIKKQTIVSFNNAIENNETQDILSKAKNYIDSNKYVSAFLILSKSGSQQKEFPFVGLIPIGIIIIVALILKNKLKNQNIKENNNKKLVLEEWEK